MPSSQLWRMVLAPSPLSADEQGASPDAHGSYGRLMDAIDLVLRQIEEEGRDGASSG